MKTILVPTDFSGSSLNAVNYAANLAADIKASLLLLHVVDIPATVITEFPVGEIGYHQMSRLQDLANLKHQLRVRTANKIEITCTEVVGNIDNEIKEICKQINPFAVVMSSHAAGALERFLFGSITAYSSHHLQSPVINVPPGSVYKPIHNIVFACDFKNIYHLPVEEIKSIARDLNAGIELLYVDSGDTLPQEIEIEKLLLQKRLFEFKPPFTFIKSETLEQGVEKYVVDHAANMILVVPRSHGIFHASKSEQVIFHLPFPAISIHEA